MKNLIVLILLSISLFSCKNKSKTNTEQGIEAPTENEVKEFEAAANEMSKLLETKVANLSFDLDGITYQLKTKDVKTTFIPFTSYKPINEEEGEMQEESLIWMQGTDSVNNAEITFSVSLNQKFGNGSFVSSNGELNITKEGKKDYYTVESMKLNISNFSAKKFNENLSGYSLDMSFEGNVETFGSKTTTTVITNGKYELKY